MNDFKSYSNSKSNPNNGGTHPFNGRNGTSSSNENKIPDGGGTALNNTVELAKIISKAMSGKSTVQIMQTIVAEAERGKREGKLTNQDLDNFYTALSPLLDGAKKRKLKQVIENLKSI